MTAHRYWRIQIDSLPAIPGGSNGGVPSNAWLVLVQMAATPGGVNLIAFTTGRGSAIGFPTIPVLKIASNMAVWKRMRENMDVNAGPIAEGERTVQEVGAEIFNLLLKVASGERTAAERLGHKEFVPWRIGPVL